MSLEAALRDPVILKLGGAAALWVTAGDHKTARYAAAGLLAWAAYDYWQRQRRPPLAVSPVMPTPAQVPQPAPFSVIPGRPQVSSQSPPQAGSDRPEGSLAAWRRTYGPHIPPPERTMAWFEYRREQSGTTTPFLAGDPSDGAA